MGSEGEEKVVKKSKEMREREREREKWSHWVTLSRTTQARKSKSTIQINCEPKSGLAQRPYVGDAQEYNIKFIQMTFFILSFFLIQTKRYILFI